MAFVIIGIGDKPKSVKLDAYHIDQIKVQTRFLIVFLFYTCLPLHFPFATLIQSQYHIRPAPHKRHAHKAETHPPRKALKPPSPVRTSPQHNQSYSSAYLSLSSIIFLPNPPRPGSNSSRYSSLTCPPLFPRPYCLPSANPSSRSQRIIRSSNFVPPTYFMQSSASSCV